MSFIPMKTFGFAVLLWVAAIQNSVAAPGDLDPTFGAGGVVLHTEPVGTMGVADMKALADGKLIVAGTLTDAGGNKDFALRRFHPDGSVDVSFGVNGLAVASIDPTDGDAAAAMTFQSGGRILVAGKSREAATGRNVFALVRFTSSGALDTSFSGDGLAVYATPGVDCEAEAVAIQSDGRFWF